MKFGLPNQALQRTRPSHHCCNPAFSWAGSLSLGRSAARRVSMKFRRPIIFTLATVIVLGGAVIYLFAPPGRTVRITGPLTAQDVNAIRRFVFDERAPLVSGDFAPRRLGVSAAAKVKLFCRNLRERAAGELRSIATSDGQAVVVDFGDRWNSAVRYEYYIQRTPNGWKIAGLVNRGL